MLAAMPIIIGTQFLLAFLNYDIQSMPSMALHPRLEDPVHNVRCAISILQKRRGRPDCALSHIVDYGRSVAASERTGPVG